MIKGKLGSKEVGDGLPTLVVGVINLSPASFYQQSIASSSKNIEQISALMIEEGAQGLDIGAQSTRPIQIYGGEGRVNEETELKMVKEAVEIVIDVSKSYSKIELSVDTTRSVVAEFAMSQGIRTINDISGFKNDNKIAKIIADFDGSAVVMAAKEKPGDVFQIQDIIQELETSIEIGRRAGIDDEQIIIDPGIGSWEARDFKHDYNIIQNLEDFRILNKPIYVGISRKTSIGKALNDAPPEERLFGSIGATILATIQGAHIVRTHDVKPTLDAIRVTETIMNYKAS